MSSADTTVPGFTLAPLDNLVIGPFFSPAQLVTFDSSIHRKQHEMDVTVLPFTRTPMRLLERLKSVPAKKVSIMGQVNQTEEEAQELVVRPAAMREVLFAAYPLLLPLCMSSLS